MGDIIFYLEPSIKKALNQTNIKNREELKQELHFKIINKVSKEDIENIPGFFETIINDDTPSATNH